MTLPEVHFTLESGRTARQARDRLTERFRTRRDGRLPSRCCYLDTFDWRLYHDGGTLTAEPLDVGWMLHWRALDGSCARRLRVARIPEFARELEPGPFREALLPVTGIRRLLPVVRLETDSERIAILDSRDKTVARVFHERGSATVDGAKQAKALPERLRVAGVVGYEEARRRVVDFLEQTLETAPQTGVELQLALAAVGRRPGEYSSKINVRLDPQMRSDQAVKRILLRLFETMRDNEDGTRRDLDPEFLHDFRVAVRRTRSCLGQLKGLYEAETLDPFRREFAWLGQVTGRTRDLDVYLLGIDDYRAEVAESLRPGIDPLEDWLRREQQAEQRKVAAALDSARYRKLVARWAAFLETAVPAAPGAGCPDALRPVRELAAERIRKCYQRIHKRGRALEQDSAAKLIHRLRIDCKKLRYLLEFFRSVLDAERAAGLVRSLKRLQDRLGDFNDLEVQQADLERTSVEIAKQGGETAQTLLAMGCLVGRLADKQGKLKKQVLASVREFVTDETRTNLWELVR